MCYLATVKYFLSSNGSISNLLSNGLAHLMLVEVHQRPIKMPIANIYGQLDTLKCRAFGCLWHGYVFQVIITDSANRCIFFNEVFQRIRRLSSAHRLRVSIRSQSQKWNTVAIAERYTLTLCREIHQCMNVYPTELSLTELSYIKDKRAWPWTLNLVDKLSAKHEVRGL